MGGTAEEVMMITNPAFLRAAFAKTPPRASAWVTGFAEDPLLADHRRWHGRAVVKGLPWCIKRDTNNFFAISSFRAGADEAVHRRKENFAACHGMAGSLPGALGQLSIEADKFAKIGMPIDEAARRAMDSNPALVTMAKLLLADVRRNAPENTPVPADKAAAAGLAQGKTPGDTVHLRAQALTDEHPHLGYRAAMGRVLHDDPALKAAYAGVR